MPLISDAHRIGLIDVSKGQPMNTTAQPSPLARNRWRILGWGTAAGLILLPLIAMQFTSEVDWGLEDFVFAIVMIGGVGLLFEFAVRASRNIAYRAGVAAALLAGFLTIWINLAVGIVGSEDNPVNAIYLFVPLIALAGSAISLFRTRGMFITMCVTTAAMLATFVYVLIATGYFALPITIFFAAFWGTSAALFRRAMVDEEAIPR